MHANPVTRTIRRVSPIPESHRSQSTANSLWSNILRVSSYFRIFCASIRIRMQRNDNESNILADIGTSNLSASIPGACLSIGIKSLFFNILPISSYSRILCAPQTISLSSKYNQSNILSVQCQNYFSASSLALQPSSSGSAPKPAPASQVCNTDLCCLPDFLHLSTMNVYPHCWASPRNL